MASKSNDDKASTALIPCFSYASYLALPDDDSFDWPSDFENDYIELSLNGDHIIRPTPAPAPVPAPTAVPVPSPPPAPVPAIPASVPPAPPCRKAKRKRAKKGPVKGRKCSHCSTEKTPQWRPGPEGPNTLCNACWMRYKSGRLMPEYRPAKSSSLDPTKYSNSHKKVLELRKEKGSPAPEEGSPAM